MAIYAIGDVQGCFGELVELVAKLDFSPQRDQLWFTGDIVNRGPQSLDVLRYVKELGTAARVVLGNHDLHLLALANDAGKEKPTDTLSPILQASDANTLLKWLRQQPLMVQDSSSTYFMVHAGIYPWWSIETALERAREVETILRGKHHHKFFSLLYGNNPQCWHDALGKWDRLRFITNCFTRMRYCDNNGNLLLKQKSAPGDQPRGVKPWFEFTILKNDESVANVIFGHWSTLGRYHKGNILGLDSGCVWGGALTAAKIGQGPIKFISVPSKQEAKFL